MKNLLCGVLVALAATGSCADEGMWLLSRPPTEAIKAAYGFEPTAAWLEHMQKSAVRFETGGSGSIVSADGLVMTNHHVGSDMLAKLSTPERDLLALGFCARTHEEELKCPDLEVRVLWEVEDVTARVNAAAAGGASSAEAGALRRKAIAEIEGESSRITGLTSEVVALYQGGVYQLYRYKSYSDVRLVFAPESQIAFFGGDADNFEFPRYNLDCCFFRLYENGAPVRAEHFLTWSKAGAAEDELIFIFGHPGSTRRALSADHLAFMRDVDHPTRLSYLWRAEIKLSEFAGRGAEEARLAKEDRLGFANGRKAYTGQLSGLQDGEVFGAKARAERELRAMIEADPKLRESTSGAWEAIAGAQRAHAELFVRKYALERVTRGSLLADAALHIVRMAEELKKPNGERLPEYTESSLASTYLSLYSPQPVHEELEVLRLGTALGFIAERLGCEDPVAAKLLAGRAPMDRARDLVGGCTFKDPAARRTLVESGAEGLAESKDPFFVFARDLSEAMGAVRVAYEDRVEAVERPAYAKIAAAKFALRGDKEYPDATFTLRMTYGKVTGLVDAGKKVPAFTMLGGTFERAELRKGEADFELPASWLKARPELKADVPFNFVCTADIIGGNSGSPVVNSKGEVVGLVFDGNIHSLTGSFVYDAAKNRAVAVDSRGMLEAFKTVYRADELVRELTRPVDLSK